MSVLLLQTPNWPIEEYKLGMQSVALPSVGLGYIAAVLKKNGISCSILDLNFDPIDKVIAFIRDNDIKLVGVTTYSSTFRHFQNTVRHIKQECPGVKIVGGGVHVTYDYRSILKELPVDYVVRFEGEYPFLELCNALLYGKGEPRSIPNVAYLDGLDLVYTKERPLIEDLDTLPFPLLDTAKYPKRAVPILTSRGCPQKCIYCASSAFWGLRIRYRSLSNVREELTSYSSKGVRSFTFLDDNLNVNRQRFSDLCRITKELGITWETNCSFSALDEGLIDIMSESGCTGISCGIESADPSVQRSTGKSVDIEKAIGLAKYAVSKKIMVMCGLMLFHYCDTKETVQQTIKLGERIRAVGALPRFAINTPFKGTYQYEHADELGLKIYKGKPEEYDLQHSLLDTKYFKREEMKDASISLNKGGIDVEKIKKYALEHNLTGSDQLSPEVIQDVLKMLYKNK